MDPPGLYVYLGLPRLAVISLRHKMQQLEAGDKDSPHTLVPDLLDMEEDFHMSCGSPLSQCSSSSSLPTLDQVRKVSCLLLLLLLPSFLPYLLLLSLLTLIQVKRARQRRTNQEVAALKYVTFILFRMLNPLSLSRLPV